MKDIVAYIIDRIIADEKVTVTEEETDGFITITITAPQEQMGKIIGKGGKTINSIKNLVKIKAIKDGKRVDVQVVEQQ